MPFQTTKSFLGEEYGKNCEDSGNWPGWASDFQYHFEQGYNQAIDDIIKELKNTYVKRDSVIIKRIEKLKL